MEDANWKIIKGKAFKTQANRQTYERALMALPLNERRTIDFLRGPLQSKLVLEHTRRNGGRPTGLGDRAILEIIAALGRFCTHTAETKPEVYRELAEHMSQ